MNKPICGIYKITNKINNKSYIGQSIDIQRRFRSHHTEPFNPNSQQYNSIFYKAIRKYGISNFIFEIIEECLPEQLNEQEQFWITYYNTNINESDGYGYNMTEGGETKQFLREYDINLIQQLWKEGKTHQEICNIIPCNNSVLTRYLNFLNIPIEERRHRANLYKAKPVLRYSLTGKFIAEYDSLISAAKALQLEGYKGDTGNISYACNKQITSAYDNLWKYKDDNTTIEDLINNAKSKLHHRNQKVNQYDLSGKYIKTFNTIVEAKNTIESIHSNSAITNCCSGLTRTSGGFIWRYFNDNDNPPQNLILSQHSNVSKKKKEKEKKEIICLIDQYDLNNHYLTTYQNMLDAATAVGLKNKNNIWKACNGYQHTAGGYIWKYHTEHKEV